MNVGYARPVDYQSNLLFSNSSHEPYMINPLYIKKEPGTFDDLHRESSTSSFLYSKMEDYKLPAMKDTSVMEDEQQGQLTSWITKHPQHWTRREVLDWVFYVVDQKHLDGSKLKGESYSGLTGERLCAMSKLQFELMDPCYGIKMYETLRSLINDVSIEEPKPAGDVSNLDSFNHINSSDYNNLNKNINDGLNGRPQHHNNSNNSQRRNSNSGLVVYQADNDMKVDLPHLGIYTISTDFELPLPSSSSATQSFLPRGLTAAASFTTPPPSSTTPSPHYPQFDFPVPEYSSPSLNIPSSKSRSLSSSSSSASLYGPVFPGSCLSNDKLNFSTRRQLSSTSSMLSTSSSTSLHPPHDAAPASLSLSLSLTVPSSLSASPSSSSPSMCRPDYHDQDYGSDDSMPGTFMPPYQPSSRGNAFTSGPMSEEVARGMRRGGLFPDDVIADCVMDDKKKGDKKHKSNATKNGNHLWEFVRDLLRDPKTNPKLLKWEDKESGMFRFVQSEKVAQLWGEKKNNPLMTYEKLSRAMRFCRTAGYFDPVPKNGRFPKKLCFMFGEKAHGWRD